MPQHPDRLLPTDATTLPIACRLLQEVSDLPLISPHGHTDPRWYAEDDAFPDPATLFVTPDHYVLRMLYSQGVALEDLGVVARDGSGTVADPRSVWRTFADHFHLFRGTPSRYWFEEALERVFGITERLCRQSADRLFDDIDAQLKAPRCRPRALFKAFGLEVIATTDAADDDLAHHATLKRSGWSGRVVPTYRPDAVVDPDRPGFRDAVRAFVQKAGQPLGWQGYLEAHRSRRRAFIAMGATATDHGHPSPATLALSAGEATALFDRVMGDHPGSGDAEAFRAQMLTEMAAMSIDDGLVMQIHPGSFRNHNPSLFGRFGADMGADIPVAVDFTRALKPLLDRFGNDRRLTLILFTLDETTHGRELAPLAGHYPALRLGPPWWFYDSFEGMMRFRRTVTETAGFYNTVGFNDDTRAYLSIPARHDMARRVDCAYLAQLVADHRLEEDEAVEIARDLAYHLPKAAYRL